MTGAGKSVFLGAFAFADDNDTSEYHHCCKHFLPREDIHAYAYADCNCYYRLDISIHAYECRADAFLSYRYKEI